MSRTRSAIVVRIEHEVLVILGLAIGLILVTYVWPNHAVRVALGLLCCIALPGYMLLAALFPSRDDLGTVERSAFSFGLSVIMMILLGLLLNYSPWGISLESVLVVVISFILLCSGAAYYRRKNLCRDMQSVVRLDLPTSHWQDIDRVGKWLTASLVLSIVVAIGVFVYATGRPKRAETFTEFYVLGPSGMAESYAREVVVGEAVHLVVGVANYEHDDVLYHIEIDNGTSRASLASFQLGHEAKWEQDYSFALNEPGENRKVTFLLRRDDDVMPYRSLHLWFTVRKMDDP